MEISEYTDAILSDDYEEGEILDEDTLYDNVSSLEEFSGSDSELKTHGEISSVVVKKTCEGRKEKRHKRKEHKCKEDSICRKERSGKHCYARIRKSKTTVEAVEKSKTVELATVFGYDQNHKKKSYAVLPPVHGPSEKNDSRRLPMQRDLLEKENRCSHKHLRYYDFHKSLSHRIDKKKVCENLIKKHLATQSRSRSHESRKRSKSQSPKLLIRNQLKKVAPRGGTSLLKRLVGSGSIGVKTPKEIEEPKKSEATSAADKVVEELPKEVIDANCSGEYNKEGENQIIEDDTIKKQETTESLNLEVILVEEYNKQNSGNEVTTENSGKDCEGVEEDPVKVEGSCCVLSQEKIPEATSKITVNGSVTECKKHPVEKEELETMEVNEDTSVVSQEEDTPTLVNESTNDSNAKNDGNEKNIEGEFSHKDDNQKNQQDIAEDIDELNLRLEALRTAMLRKHKERKKRGFICKKKSTLEDDSFAEYVLNNIEKDNGGTTNAEDDEGLGHTDSNGVNLLGDLMNPEDMVIDKNDKDNESNILENFSYPSSYPVQNASDVSLHYLGFADPYPVFTYPELNVSVAYPHLGDNRNLVDPANRNIPQDFSGYVYPNNQLFVPPTIQDTAQIPLPEDNKSFSIAEFKSAIENQPKDDHSLQHCLKEINSNKETFVASKRARRISTKLKLCRRKEWHSSRAVMKRKLIRREYAQQKRRRRESLRDLKIIKTEEEEIEHVREESDEETTLRELALKSVKEKPKNVVDDETLKSVDNHVNNGVTSIKIGEGGIFQQLQIEIDNNNSEKPLISCDSGSTPTNLSSGEPWDDIDEDILRAQLLSSLSSKMPSKNLESNKTFLSRFTKKQIKALRRADRKSLELRADKRLKHGSLKVNKENFKKISKIKSADLGQRKLGVLRIVNNLKKKPKTHSQPLGQNAKEVPVVPKFIISLNEDSSSEDEVQTSPENDRTDVVRSIDLFLQEARIENDLKQGLVRQDLETGSSKSDEVKHSPAEIKIIEKNTDTGRGTPQVLKHLPAWQQEEYRRLKKQIAEKEKLLKAAKEKILLPFESELIKGSVLPKNSSIKNNLNDEENEVCQKNVEEIIGNASSETNSEYQLNTCNINEVKNNNDTNVISSSEGMTKVLVQQQRKVKTLPASPVKSNDRSRIVEEVNYMAKVVAHLEKEMGSFRNLYKDIVQKKKELLEAKLNMARKKNMLFEIRKRYNAKEKLLQAKLEDPSPLSPDVVKVDQNDTKKQARRDMELCKLRMREFSLRTKMIFDEIENTGLNKIVKQSGGRVILPIDKSKVTLKTALQSNQLANDRTDTIRLPNEMSTEKSKSVNNEPSCQTKGPLSFSENQSECWDPFVPICPFDLSGVCKDEECKFQHLKTS